MIVDEWREPVINWLCNVYNATTQTAFNFECLSRDGVRVSPDVMPKSQQCTVQRRTAIESR